MSSPKIRKAFIMSVFPGKESEYAQRHAHVWPELLRVLKEHGVSNYSIFLDEQTSQIFACLEIESEEKFAAIADTDVCKRWWKYMAEIMSSNDDNSPVVRDCRQVFNIE
ncbi:L-rhamnose mutarotase [Terrimicrobium sacchariphilum]|uniref:L-rhamnose mutarotase n=1 Tax=Terrimicrobium sacchariphilum TaxID=690879 RepID=A0A146G5C2_TERSA|nr:L-rhamnose mutarotase [Terrimicrobium sacchariphilum]GAT32184.1 L-rhamnose mutarotase [Terrimicrobium sacchariphilum]